jgi:hypothetical protein
MLDQPEDGSTTDSVHKKQIFSLLILYKNQIGIHGAWGFCYPEHSNGYLLTQRGKILSPAVNLSNNKNYYCDYQDHDKKAGIKAGAKNISRQFTTGQREQHQ